jgi:hypothetical protein
MAKMSRMVLQTCSFRADDLPERQETSDGNCAGWEVVCPDGRVRHLPYHNLGDARSHARFASRPDWFAKRGCRLAPKTGRLEQSQPPCLGGEHSVRLVVVSHVHTERAEA